VRLRVKDPEAGKHEREKAEAWHGGLRLVKGGYPARRARSSAAIAKPAFATGTPA
jgi:hypothetical protein